MPESSSDAPKTHSLVPPQLQPYAIQPGEVKNPLGRSAPRKRFVENIRAFLESIDPKTEKTNLQTFFEDMKKVVSGRGKNSVKALELLLNYAYGKPESSPADLEALEKGGIKVIMLPAIQVGAALPKPDQPAEFIDAELEPEIIPDETGSPEANRGE